MIIVIMIRAIRGTSFLTILRLVIIVGSIVLLADRSYASSDHVCIRYESYTELETVPRNQTVQVLTREWCLEIPPRCTSYRPEIKEVYVKQNVTRSRKIEFCCEGYEERMPQKATNINGTGRHEETHVCHPICRGGCGRGVCESPNNCGCEAGFTGKHCIQRCRNGTWGENCKHRCHCQNLALCESKTGHCRCADGWIGTHCESPCPAGHFGTLCKTRCNCNTTRCDHKTGKCLIDDGFVMFENVTRIVESNFSGESTERISVDQWVKVETSTSAGIISNKVTTEDNSPLPINSTYAQSFQEYLPANTSISLIPIENMTTTTEVSQNDTVYEIVTSTTKLEITFIDTSLNKIEPSSIESTTSDENGINKDSELVFVESENQPELVVLDEKEASSEDVEEEEVDNKQAIATISCLLLTLALLLSVVAYMKNVNRKTVKKQHQQQPLKCTIEGKGPDSPRILEPLPDLPRVIYTKIKAKNQRSGSTQLEHYDVPGNNTSVNKSSPYNYNFTMSKMPHNNLPRKYSLEHIYDEIQYPPYSEMSGTGQESNDHFSKSILTDSKMTPVKVIDEVKGK